MKHYCPMCGEQWDDNRCGVCGWSEPKSMSALDSTHRGDTMKRPAGEPTREAMRQGHYYGNPLEASIEDGRLVIAIGIQTLAHATAFADWANPFDEAVHDYIRTFAIEDAPQFATDVVNAMLIEREDGSTPLSDFIDTMAQAALDDGSLGLHEDEQQIKHGTFAPCETWSLQRASSCGASPMTDHATPGAAAEPPAELPHAPGEICGTCWRTVAVLGDADHATAAPTPATVMDTERLEAIRERLSRASQGQWTAYRMTHEDRGDDLTPDELGEYVKNSVVKSAEASGSSAFLFVSVQKPDGGADVCHVGNGPTSPQNADFIAHAPGDIAFLLAARAADALRHQQEIADLSAQERQRRDALLGGEACEAYRNVQTPCKSCGGWGVVTYGSTATWRGGIGGQAMTPGVCDRCWGSGDEHRRWPSWRDTDTLRAALSTIEATIHHLRESMWDCGRCRGCGAIRGGPAGGHAVNCWVYAALFPPTAG